MEVGAMRVLSQASSSMERHRLRSVASEPPPNNVELLLITKFGGKVIGRVGRNHEFYEKWAYLPE